MTLDKLFVQAQQASQVLYGKDWESFQGIKHLGEEIIELTEAWTRRNKADIASELADVLNLVAMIAGHEGIGLEDLRSAQARKLDRWLRQHAKPSID